MAKSSFKENPDLDIFASNARYIDDAGVPMTINHFTNVPYGSQSSKTHVCQNSRWFEVPPPIFASVFRRNKLASIGFFTYRGFALDVWMFHHLAMADGYTLVYNHEPKVSYRRNTTSSSNQICNHALSYAEGLLEYQRIFDLDTHVTSFRLHAVNFAVTALVKNRTNPLAATRFVGSLVRIGFLYDLIKAVSVRAFRSFRCTELIP